MITPQQRIALSDVVCPSIRYVQMTKRGGFTMHDNGGSRQMGVVIAAMKLTIKHGREGSPHVVERDGDIF